MLTFEVKKSLPKLFDKYLNHMLVIFETSCIGFVCLTENG